MIEAWNRLEQEPLTPETVLIHPVWLNRYIKIGNKTIKNLLMTPIFISDIYAENGSITPWTRFKTKFQVSQNNYFKWMQTIDSFLETWKQILKNNTPFPPFAKIKHIKHTLQLTKILPIENLLAKQCYLLLIHKKRRLPTHKQK